MPDAMRRVSFAGISRYADIARDGVAAIVNDVISVGAAWYGNQQRSLDLLRGWRAACEEAGAVWGGGESPALPGIVMPDAIELAGSALGLVPAGRDPVLGADVTVGDKIVLLASSGLHANGASPGRRRAARRMADGTAQRPAPGRRGYSR
jgi:phosphoribosylformylglycinamidine cyclo-ligase